MQLEQKERARGNFDNATQAEAYKNKVEEELQKMCDELLKMLRNVLLPKASTGEDKVFFLKMKGECDFLSIFLGFFANF